MRTQYTVSIMIKFMYWITTYHDGVKIQMNKVWADDFADFTDKLEADGSNHFTWCGDGILDFEKIGDALKKAGTEYVFIEQDRTFPDEPNPFVCLANSRGYLKSLGFEF